MGERGGDRSIGEANLRKGAALLWKCASHPSMAGTPHAWPARPVPASHRPKRTQKSRNPPTDCGFFIQAWVGIEPTVKLLQSHALPLGYHAVNKVLLSEKIFAIASFFIPFPEDGGNTRTST